MSIELEWLERLRDGVRFWMEMCWVNRQDVHGIVDEASTRLVKACQIVKENEEDEREVSRGGSEG